MRFTNIRFANKEVKLDWEEKTDQEIDTHDKKSAEPPTDDFKAALDNMRKHLPLCSDLPESYVASAEMLSVGISYNAQSARSVTLQAKRKVTNSNSPMNINTPPIKETEEIRDGSLFDEELGAHKALFNDVDNLCHHAARFLEGDRGEPEGDTEERETDPGQTTIEEHINEAAKGEARKAFIAIMGEKPANIGASNQQLTKAIVHRFDVLEYIEQIDDRNKRAIPGLYRHELLDDEGAVVRYVWCHVDTTADIPKLFYDAPAENFNVASATSTLVGFQMVAILREVWELPAPSRNGKKPQAGNVTADDTALAGAGV